MKTPLKWRACLASLLDVQSYQAYKLASISRNITTIGFNTQSWNDEAGKSEAECKRCLSRIIEEAEFIGLSFTKKGAQRILDLIEHSKNNQTGEPLDVLIAGRLDTLEERFYDEVEEINFFYVKSDRLKWFENTELAGDEFKTNFPTANAELIEAGNCFALDRYTACIFHLTRSLEVVLASLHYALKIQEPTDEHDKTWGRTLGRISEKIKENDTTTPPGWASDAEFYKKVNGLLAAVKTPYRDSTIHVASVYDESGAIGVLMAVVGALSHIGKKLKEKP
jgi:hypothetical protein